MIRILYLQRLHINLDDIEIQKSQLLIHTSTIKSKGDLIMILSYLKIEFKVIMRKKQH